MRAARRPHEVRAPLMDPMLLINRRLGVDSGRPEVLGDRELLDFWLERATLC